MIRAEIPDHICSEGRSVSSRVRRLGGPPLDILSLGHYFDFEGVGSRGYWKGSWIMPKRKSKKLAKVPKKSVSTDWLQKALAKRTKAELVDVVMQFARADRGILRQLESQFRLEVPPKQLVAATRQAIADATDFDEREINHNFNYDYDAYNAVERDFGRLIDLCHLRTVMELSLELMDQGSYQVEMSDEGMMTEDIEECLQVVIEALKQCDLPADDVTAWCAGMLKKDRVGFICDEGLQALQDRFDVPH